MTVCCQPPAPSSVPVSGRRSVSGSAGASAGVSGGVDTARFSTVIFRAVIHWVPLRQ